MAARALAFQLTLLDGRLQQEGDDNMKNLAQHVKYLSSLVYKIAPYVAYADQQENGAEDDTDAINAAIWWVQKGLGLMRRPNGRPKKDIVDIAWCLEAAVRCLLDAPLFRKAEKLATRLATERDEMEGLRESANASALPTNGKRPASAKPANDQDDNKKARVEERRDTIERVDDVAEEADEDEDEGGGAPAAEAGDGLEKPNGDLAVELAESSGNKEVSRAVGQLLSSVPPIQLDLSVREVDDEGAKAVGEALKGNKTLHTIYLRGNKIYDSGAEALGDGLANAPGVKYLNLRGNHIQEAGAEGIARALSSPVSNLREVHLSGNPLGKSGGKALGQALKDAKSLHTIYMRGCSIGSHGAKYVAGSLSEGARVICLILSGNKIGTKGAESLASALRQRPVLQHLDLRGNWLQSRGVETFGEALAANPPLQHFDLRGNGIAAEGVKALLNNLCDRPNLITLNLANNPLDDEAKEIARSAERRHMSLSVTTNPTS